MQSSAKTVSAYLAALDPARRATLSAVRDTVNASLPAGYQEVMQYGMIAWVVPTSRIAAIYNGQPLVVAALASQKNYAALYLMSVYGDPARAKWFKKAFADSGKKLDMGKSCVRFKRPEDLPLDVIGQTIAAVPMEEYAAFYERTRGAMRGGSGPSKKHAANKVAPKKKAAPKGRASPKRASPKKTKKGAAAKRAPAKARR
jgi:uncharacterized protein YdhG (YjbR/CyaY superfamily)